MKNCTFTNCNNEGTKIQLDRQGKMWAGKILEELGSELPAQYRDEAPKQ